MSKQARQARAAQPPAKPKEGRQRSAIERALAVWLSGCLSVWLAGWQAGWLAGWLAGLAGLPSSLLGAMSMRNERERQRRPGATA